jgi:hypothetical protein
MSSLPIQILQGCHVTGGHHLGRDKTLDRVAKKYYLLGIVADVKQLVRTSVHNFFGRCFKQMSQHISFLRFNIVIYVRE